MGASTVRSELLRLPLVASCITMEPIKRGGILENSARSSWRASNSDPSGPAGPPTAAIYFRLKVGLIAALTCLIVAGLTIALALLVADMVV